MTKLEKLAIFEDKSVRYTIQTAQALAQDLNSQVLATSHIFLVLLAHAEALHRPWYEKLMINSDDIYEQLLRDGHTSIRVVEVPGSQEIIVFQIKHLMNYLTEEFSRCKKDKDRLDHFILACLDIMFQEEWLTYEWIGEIHTGIHKYLAC